MKTMVKRCMDQKIRARNLTSEMKESRQEHGAKGKGKPVSVDRKRKRVLSMENGRTVNERRYM